MRRSDRRDDARLALEAPDHVRLRQHVAAKELHGDLPRPVEAHPLVDLSHPTASDDVAEPEAPEIDAGERPSPADLRRAGELVARLAEERLAVRRLAHHPLELRDEPRGVAPREEADGEPGRVGPFDPARAGELRPERQRQRREEPGPREDAREDQRREERVGAGEQHERDDRVTARRAERVEEEGDHDERVERRRDPETEGDSDRADRLHDGDGEHLLDPLGRGAHLVAQDVARDEDGDRRRSTRPDRACAPGMTVAATNPNALHESIATR